MNLYFYISFVLLAALLFVPVSKLIWVMSVRRLENKEHRKLTETELAGQKRRARLIALLLTLLFSWFFNLQIISGQQHG